MAKKKKDSEPDKEEKTEEICEVFEVKKGDKTEVKKVCVEEEPKHANKKQIENQNKILRNLVIVFGFLLIVFVAGYFVIESQSHFEIDGVKFEIVQEGDLILYQTSIPVIHEGKKADYNFYLRKDPRKVLEDVAFSGVFLSSQNMVLNMTEEFYCDGDEVISIANLIKPFQILGTEVIKDDNAKCDAVGGRYLFVRIMPGEKTEIKQTGLTCYDIKVNNCEILEATERFMLEIFMRFDELV